MMLYCRKCGKEMTSGAKFCPVCGEPVYAAPPAYPQPARLIRPRHGRMLAGVCQGLANAYVWEVSWVRVIAVLLAVFAGGLGLIAYIIFWIVMPEEPLALPPVTPYPPYPPSSTGQGNSAAGSM